MTVHKGSNKILVVDDEEESILLMKKVLVPLGYIVSGVHSGEEAVSAVEAEPPGLILMDIRLPGISGLEATRRMKALPHTAHIPILAMTASVRPEDMQTAYDAGCCGFIRKPVDIDELRKTVAENIGNVHKD